MKLKFLFFIFLFLLNLPYNLPAYVRTAVPFVRISPSSRLSGMAGAFTSLATSDVYGQYYNPAQLANFGRENNLSWQFYNDIKWLPGFSFSDFKYSSKAAAAGYNFKNLLDDLSLSIGFGYIDTDFYLGKNIWTDEQGNMLDEFESKEYYKAYSIGIGFDYYAILNFGYTFKDITSDLYNGSVDPEDQIPKATANAYDIGLQITIPIIGIINQVQKKSITVFNDFKPAADISFGYSIMNIGDDMRNAFSNTSDPLPRTAQIGFALSFSLETTIQDVDIEAFKLDFSSEGRDLLVKKDSLGRYEYISAPGAINIWENVIKGNISDEVDVHRGWRLQIYEIFEISMGNYNGIGWDEAGGVKTFGFTASSRGILKMLKALQDNKTLSFIADHFQLNYSHTEYAQKGSPLDGTIYNGVNITIFGF